MKKSIVFVSKNYMAISALFYVLLCIITFNHYQFAIDPDGESYTNLAVKYVNGDFKNAINGYWSPLITWLITPFLLIGLNKILAAKIASLLVGLIGIFAIDKFISNFIEKNSTKFVALIPCTLLLFTFSNVEVGADVLSAIILLIYFSLLYKKQFSWSYSNAVWIGIIGAIGYFSKYYIFPFFILHFFICIIILHFLDKKISIVRKLKFMIVCYGVFLLLASPWLILINKKYDIGYIFCTSGKVNLTQALNNNWKIIDSKMGYFLMPPNKTAVDFTEDISYICGRFLGVFDSAYTIKNEIANVSKNLKILKDYLNWISLFNWTILFFAIFISFSKYSNYQQRKILLLYLSVCAIYPIGYLMSYCEDRYFIVVFLLNIALGCWLMENYLFQLNSALTAKLLMGLLFMASFLISPYQKLEKYYDTMNYVNKIAMQLKNEFHLKGTLLGEGGKYGDTQYTCFAADLQNVIINPAHWNEREKLKDELQKNNINYYFYWHWKADQSDSLKSFYGFEEITKGKIYGLQIFKITPQ